MPFREDEFEFAQRMKCESITTRDGVTLFVNGGSSAAGVCLDPPRDPRALLKARIDFYAAKIELLKKDASTLRNDILMKTEYMRL